MNFNEKNHFEFGVSQERMEIIKSRIAEKYYDQEEVLLEVARRILESNDLDDMPGNYNPNLH